MGRGGPGTAELQRAHGPHAQPGSHPGLRSPTGAPSLHIPEGGAGCTRGIRHGSHVWLLSACPMASATAEPSFDFVLNKFKNLNAGSHTCPPATLLRGFASPSLPPWRHRVLLKFPPQEANSEKRYSSTKQKKAGISILNLFFGQFTQASPTKFQSTVSMACLLCAPRVPRPAGGRARIPKAEP